MTMPERITANSPVVFTFRYLFWLIALFALLYFDDFSPLVAINNLQTSLSVFLTRQWIEMFDIPVNMSGAYLVFDHGLKLRIVNYCNGLAAFLFFFAAVLSYRASIKDKITWSFLVYLVLQVANTIRLDWITYHVINHPEDFKFAHEVLGRYAIAIIPLFLFYGFSIYASRIPEDQREQCD